MKFSDFSKERILKLNQLIFALDNDEELPENFDDGDNEEIWRGQMKIMSISDWE